MRYSSFDESSSNGEEGEGDSDKGNEERQEETGICKPRLSVFHPGSGDYLCAVRGTDSLLTEKREQRQIRELERATSNSLSIKIIFTVQQLRTSHKTPSTIENTIFQSLIEKDNKKVFENKETIKARAVHDLSELIRLKTEQLKKYGAVLIPQSNLYLRYQVV